MSVARPALLTPFMLLALAGALALPVAAAPITLSPNTLNMFRDTRGDNDVGIAGGDVFQFGANIVGGSLGTSLGATYAADGFTVSQFACSPLTVNAGFCARTTPFAASSGRLDPWTLRFVNGTDTLLVPGPSLVGTTDTVPFPVSVTMSGTGLTPTISWTVPSGFKPDGFRVQIFDKNQRQLNGQADIIHSVAVPSNATSYTLPSTLSSGLTLSNGGNYTINFQLIETRGHVPFTNNNADILHRSSSFFAFTPLSGNVPSNVALPTVANGVYRFSVENVSADKITFIDPFVAVGYDYATGVGDPNFASVLLPDVGDGAFTLDFVTGGVARSVSLLHDTQFFFPQGGVSSFHVGGIEESAGIDPGNVTAFITGLTFTGAGNFTGTMTPVTVFVPTPVPEPATWLMLMLGGAGIALRRWRRNAPATA